MLQAFVRYTTVGKTVVRAIRPTCLAFKPAVLTQIRWQQTNRAFSTQQDDEADHEDDNHDADVPQKPKRKTRKTPAQKEREAAAKQKKADKLARKKEEARVAKQKKADKLAQQKEQKAREKEEVALAKKHAMIERNRPKRNINPYSLFLTERFDSIKQSDPSLSMPQISSKLSSMWRELTAEEKQKYLDRCRTEFRPKFEAARAEYEVQHPHPPKKPAGAFIHYIVARRPQLLENGAMTAPDLAKQCSQEWKAMADQEKAKYRQQYYDSVVKYRHELEQYENAHGRLPRKTSAKTPASASSEDSQE